MRVISLINNKGGVGKTTLAINIACEYARRGKSVGLMDVDPQASAMDWGNKREDRGSDNPAVISAPASQIQNMLGKARRAGTDVVVLDTPAKLESFLVNAAEASDMIVIPVRPSAMDLQAMRGTVQCLTRIVAPKLAVINAASLLTRQDCRNLEDALRAEWSLPVLPCDVWDRKSYRSSLFSGNGAAELGDTKAAAEIGALVDAIENMMEAEK